MREMKKTFIRPFYTKDNQGVVPTSYLLLKRYEPLIDCDIIDYFPGYAGGKEMKELSAEFHGLQPEILWADPIYEER